jgi:hypothetical protein
MEVGGIDIPRKRPKQKIPLTIYRGGKENEPQKFVVERYKTLIRILDEDNNAIDIRKKPGQMYIKLDGEFFFLPYHRKGKIHSKKIKR